MSASGWWPPCQSGARVILKVHSNDYQFKAKKFMITISNPNLISVACITKCLIATIYGHPTPGLPVRHFLNMTYTLYFKWIVQPPSNSNFCLTIFSSSSSSVIDSIFFAGFMSNAVRRF